MSRRRLLQVLAWFEEAVTDEHVEVEVAYLRDPDRQAWERPYGWAWVMALYGELTAQARGVAGVGTSGGGIEAATPSSEADRWARTLAPLHAIVRDRLLTWLRTTPYPQRSGTHANSAFACGLVRDAAEVTDDSELRVTVDDTVEQWYRDAAGYPAWLEPSAADFLSPVLVILDTIDASSSPRLSASRRRTR